MDTESAIQAIQSAAQNNPVTILGSGASMPHMPGMRDLADHLVSHITPADDEVGRPSKAHQKYTRLRGHHRCAMKRLFSLGGKAK